MKSEASSKAWEILAGTFALRGAAYFGACDYAGALPLIPCRAASRLPEKPLSVIACLFPYYTGDFPGRNVSRYAIADDYHIIVGNILGEASLALSAAFPDEEFPVFSDISPIREKEAARLCGLGDIGLNGLLINRDYGSYVFIGCIVSSMHIDPVRVPGGRCAGCGKCVEACPSGALRYAPTPPDMTLCRSWITQKNGVLSEWEENQVREGGLAWGCDICQEACPRNQAPRLTPIQDFYSNPMPIITVENLGEAYRLKPYNYRKKNVLLRNLALLRG